MSRGAGKTERAIEAYFNSPDTDGRVLTVSAICEHVYGAVERKHRVAAIRAAKRVAERLGWVCEPASMKGGSLLFYNPMDAMARAVLQWHHSYYEQRDYKTEDAFRQMCIERGHGVEGSWDWLQVEILKAKRAGDKDRLKRLRMDERNRARRSEREMERMFARIFG